MYIVTWRTPTIDANKLDDIEIPVGAVVSNRASIRFTGKGAANYGTIQQENLMRLLENFAGPTPPDFPTVGELWFDSSQSVLRLCSSTSPIVWRAMAGVQVTNEGDAPPTPAVLGDMWFQRTGVSSGILYAYTGLGRFPTSSTTIGGWNQIWPTVETVAGREEYDALRMLVLQLTNTIDGGSGAYGTALSELAPLSAYDVDLRAKHTSRGADGNVLVGADNTELMVDVTSQDWDRLLAAAKYAVNRLDLPAGLVDDISSVPFISDGRPADPSLLALSASDIRYPSLERRSNRRFGLVTLIRAFTETVNVLNAAVTNRYALKGINGASGANTTFDSTTQIVHHALFAGNMGGASSGFLRLRFNFPAEADKLSFLQSGGAIQITLTQGLAGAGAGDAAASNLFDQRGVIRVTNDKVRAFGSSLPLTLTVAPGSLGIRNATSSLTELFTAVAGTANYKVEAINVSTTAFDLQVTYTTPSAMSSTTSLDFAVIKSNETYATPAPTPVYGSPYAYGASDKIGGTAALVFVS